MTGHDDDDLGPDDFGPPPHPDDRLWIHPAEMAAMRAAAAAAEAPTVELPAVEAIPTEASDDPTRRPGRRTQRALTAAAAVALVGVSAVTVATLRASEGSERVASTTALADLAPTEAAPRAQATAVSVATSMPSEPTTDRASRSGAIEAVAVADTTTEAALAARLHEALSPSMPRVQAATPSGMREGSGFFVTEHGHVVTSAELIANADYLLVWTDDGGRWHAEVLAQDPFSDVAILRAADAPASPASFKDGPDPWSGQYALAIDHERNVMIVGEVASLAGAAPSDRPGDRSSRLLIDPGMVPGAAIVDDAGAVIGMVNGTDTGTHATPGWLVERVLAELLDGRVPTHPWLGVHAEPGPDGSTVRLLTIVGGSPADAAGLRAGDIVDAVDDAPLGASSSFWTLLQRHEPGAQLQLAVTRNGERRLITVELAERGDGTG